MNKAKKTRLPLALLIFISLALGILTGILLAATGSAGFANSYIQPLGTIFLNLIKWIVTPLVFFSIMSGVISMKDIRKVGSVGLKTVIYYLITTAFAISIGLAVANMMKGIFPVLKTAGLVYEGPDSSNFMDVLVDMFPSNFIGPFSEANMLQIIVSSLFIGFALLILQSKKGTDLKAVDTLNDLFMTVMGIIIKLSPIGVFCLITPVIADNGPEILGSLAGVLLVAYVGYIIHMIAVYSTAVKLGAGISPFRFFKGMLPAIGSIPINEECTQKLGADKSITSFVLPLGATVNMDGTAIYQGVCAIFIASCYGIELTFSQMITIVLTATVASIGTAGAPGAGMLMLAMVLQSVGLPVEGIALVAGIDRVFDMGRTTVNITGDASCAIVVSAIEDRKALRREKKAASDADD